MDLILFTTFIVISFILVALGFYRSEHTELTIIGFTFLFLLSMVVIGDNLTYKTGELTITTNSYGLVNGSYELTGQTLNNSFSYSNYTESSGFFDTHNFGYLLAVMSGIGLAVSFASIKGRLA